MSLCPACGVEYDDKLRFCPADGTLLPAAASTDPHLGQILDGKYRIDARIGQGGMGTIYRATHVMLGRTVAIKLINPALTTAADMAARFQREARAASLLTHPNIAATYDLGQTGTGTLYIAMEFVDGEDLNHIIKTSGRLPPARISVLLRQLASALSAAHARHIVHRDLKPQNIMIAKDASGAEVAKLLDFGLAKTLDESTGLTRSGLMLGTPLYMSPEQVTGEAADTRSDIYSLGAILYEMLVGEVPFTGATTTAVVMKHVNEAPVLPSRRLPDVPIHPQLESIAMRCLAKQPADRFQTVDEILVALGTGPPSTRIAPAAATPAVQETVVIPRPTRLGPAARRAAPAKGAGVLRLLLLAALLAAIGLAAMAWLGSRSTSPFPAGETVINEVPDGCIQEAVWDLAVSDSGRYIAYVASLRCGSEPVHDELVLRDRTIDVPRRIGPASPHGLAFTPDAAHLAFFSEPGSNGPFPRPVGVFPEPVDLAVLDLSTGRVRTLPKAGYVKGTISLSDDGRFAVVSSWLADEPGLVRWSNIETQEQREFRGRAARLSADGKAIAYKGDLDGLRVVAPDGSQLTSMPGDPLSANPMHFYEGDRSLLVYPYEKLTADDRDDRLDFFALNLAAHEIKRLPYPKEKNTTLEGFVLAGDRYLLITEVPGWTDQDKTPSADAERKLLLFDLVNGARTEILSRRAPMKMASNLDATHILVGVQIGARGRIDTLLMIDRETPSP